MREGGSQDELVARVRKLVQMTNPIQGGFEKPELLDSISDQKYTRGFLAALDNLLHGAESLSDRLEDFTTSLNIISGHSWQAEFFQWDWLPANRGHTLARCPTPIKARASRSRPGFAFSAA